MRPDPTDELAADLQRRGLAAPARLLLDAHAPLRPFLGHALTFVSPMMRPILGQRLDTLEAAIADDVGWNRLLSRLAGEDGG